MPVRAGRPRPRRLFLFDLDGTLIDSRRDIAAALNIALGQAGFPEIAPERIVEFVGEGVQVLIQRALRAALGREPDERTVARCLELYLAVYEEHMLDTTRLYPGTREALDRLSWAVLGVVTNKPERFTRRLLEAFQIAARFCAILGGDSAAERKPDPGPLRLAMERCGAAPAETVMVGDSAVDIQAGRAAGVLTCGIAGGFGRPEELERAGCDLLIGSIAELPEHFCAPPRGRAKA